MMSSFSPLARRRLLQIGSIGLTGLSLPTVLRAAPSPRVRAKACILLYMDGGPSHIDLFDLKPHAPVEIRGPYRGISTSVSGLEICEHLPLVARQMHLVTLIRSVCHEQTVHDPTVYQMLTGYKHTSSAGGLKVEADDVPQMGTAFGCVDRTPAVMPKVIELPETMKMEGRVLPGQSAGFLGPAYDPFRVQITSEPRVLEPEFQPLPGMTAQLLNGRASLLREFNRELCRLQTTAELSRFDVYQQQALDILSAPQVAAAFSLDREPADLRDRYGRNRHGQSVLLARRLIEAGSRFVTVYWGREDQDWADGRGPRPANNPWDTHRNHFPLVTESLLPRADRALAALLEDLQQRGLLDETLVVWMGDFGRTPRITKPWASRDHWPYAFSILMAGAGVRRGAVYGATDAQAAYVTADPISPADLTATIFDALGVDHRALVRNQAGQPHRISTGRPVRELFA
jgi:hypothetical protein